MKEGLPFHPENIGIKSSNMRFANEPLLVAAVSKFIPMKMGACPREGGEQGAGAELTFESYIFWMATLCKWKTSKSCSREGGNQTGSVQCIFFRKSSGFPDFQNPVSVKACPRAGGNGDQITGV